MPRKLDHYVPEYVSLTLLCLFRKTRYLCTLSIPKIIYPQWQMNELQVWTNGGMTLSGETRAPGARTVPCTPLSTLKCTWIGLVLNMDLQHERPVTNCPCFLLPEQYYITITCISCVHIVPWIHGEVNCHKLFVLPSDRSRKKGYAGYSGVNMKIHRNKSCTFHTTWSVTYVLHAAESFLRS